MPDWNAIVRDRPLRLDLPAKEQQEVVTELASHLEDLYEEQMRKGISEPEARENATGEMVRWRKLAKDINSAKLRKGMMNARTKQLWLPGLVSLATSMVFLMILVQISMQPRYLGRSPLQMVLLPWLALLPPCGAAGAYLSRRGGARLPARLVSGLVPMIVLFSVVGILIVTHFIVLARPHLPFISIWIALGIVLPSVALLLGTAPFLKATK